MRKPEDPVKHLERCRRYRSENREKFRESQRRYRAAHRETIREYNRRYREAHSDVYAKWREANADYFAQYSAAHREERRAYARKYRAAARLRSLVADGFVDMASPPYGQVARHARRIIGNAMCRMGDRAFPAGIELNDGFRYLVAMCLFSADSEDWPARAREILHGWNAIADRRGRRWYIDRLHEASKEARRLGAPEWAAAAIAQPSATILESAEETEE